MVMNLGQQMMNSLVAVYAHSLGATATMVGVIMSMFTVTALLFKVISGPAIDTYNKKYILMGAILTLALAYFGYGISKSVPMLIGVRLIQGAGQAFSATCCLALAADALPTNRFGAGISFFSLAQVVCQAIGPTAGLALVDVFGYNTTFIIGSAIMFFAAIIAMQIKNPYTKTKKFKISLDSIIAKEAILPATILLLLNVAFTVIGSFLIIFASKQGVESNIGLFFTVYALTMLITRPLVGKLSDRFGIVKVIIPAIIMNAAAFVIISLADSLIVFLTAAFVFAFGFGACQPAIQSLAMKCVPKERRGAASSTSYIGNDLGNLIGPLLAGAVIEWFGYVTMWRVMIFPMIIAIVIVLAFRKKFASIEDNFRINAN